MRPGFETGIPGARLILPLASAHEKAALAYNEARDRVVIFGGSMDKTVFDDTWEWDQHSLR